MMFGMAGVASATIIETVELNFASGALWEGTITFNDGYEGMIGVSGYLSGGTNNYSDVYFYLTSVEGINPNPFDSNNDGFYDDFLWGDYNYILPVTIGLSWKKNANFFSLQLLENSYYSGIFDSHNTESGVFDKLESWSIISSTHIPEPDTTSPIPEPATLILFGAGLAGLAAVGRRRKAE